MQKISFILAATVFALTLSGCKVNGTASVPPSDATPAIVTAPAATKTSDAVAEQPGAAAIEWLTIEQAAAKQQHEPRKLVIDVYTDWCGWCKKMDKTTFKDPAVAAYINAHYYAVKLDAEGKDPITLNGQTYTYNPEYKLHELAIALLNGQPSFPTTVYLDENMKMLSPVPGYMEAPAFAQILLYFGDNHYKTSSFEDFAKGSEGK
ncbi:thioredoxin fold domain-containing protein [Pontibacter chitinilyticus]|uniref:thioredoxin fold domain-containing protein n=1 Tax=Pontibacter chitinilyticus TaxID=2674989 RepID=UPI00321C3657